MQAATRRPTLSFPEMLPERETLELYFFVFRHEEDTKECLSIYAHRVITITRVHGRRPRNEAHSIRGPEK